MNCTRSGWYCDVNGDGQFLFTVHGCFHSGRDDVQLWFEPLWPMGVEFSVVWASTPFLWL